MNKKKVLLITAIATVVIICVYVFFVHNNTNNFRENNVIYFASFFSGIIVPILALLNILVFIDISKWLSVEDNNRAIRQFQLDEIKKINNLIDDALVVVPSSSTSLNALSAPIVRATCYIESFLRNQVSLFDIYENSIEYNEIQLLHSILTSYAKDFIKSYQEPIKKETILIVLNQRAKVIRILQNKVFKQKNCK